MATTKATKDKPCESGIPAAHMPRAYYELHALLGTLRSLASHEDTMCSLLANIERTGKLSASARRDIARLLGDMHVDAFHDEAGALWRSANEQAA
jgi:hypothetical protein